VSGSCHGLSFTRVLHQTHDVNDVNDVDFNDCDDIEYPFKLQTLFQYIF